MELEQIVPLVPIEGAPLGAGAGRVGILPGALPLSEVADRLRAFLGIEHLQYVGDRSVEVQRVAVACGAAGEFLAAATAAECNLLVLGETNFHTCLEAEANQILRCCCQVTMPANGLRWSSLRKYWPASSPIWRSGAAARSPIRFAIFLAQPDWLGEAFMTRLRMRV